MKLKIHAFASIRDSLGSAVVELDLEDNATVGDLKTVLSEKHPELAPLISRSAVSVDLQYANDETGLKESNEIALIPPVSGG